MKLQILAISLIFTTIIASGQDVYLSIQGSLGTFSMSGLKEMNAQVLKELPFEAKITVNFPANSSFKAYLGQNVSDHVFIAVKYSINSTGSLISRSDYSGSYDFKLRTHYHSPGILVHVKTFSVFRSKIWVCAETGYNFTSLELQESLKVSGNGNEEVMKYRSTNFYLEPGLKAKYPVYNFISAELYAGYMFDIMGKLKLKDEFDIKELIDIGHHAGYTVNWSGIRINLGIVVRIPDFKK